MKRSRRWISLAVALGVQAVTFGETILTPEQVVEGTLDHSPQLRILDREVEAATARTQQADAQGLPTLAGTGHAWHYEGIGSSAFGPFAIPFVENQYTAGVSLNQPLYTGGRITRQKEMAGYQQEATRHNRQGAEADLVLQALTAYWNWSKAFHAVESLNAAVARMESHSQDMKNLRGAGLATENDALATDVSLDQTRLRLEESQRNIDVMVARIAFLTGERPAADAVPAKIAPPADQPIPEETELLGSAQAHRQERAARVLEARAAKAQVEATKADYAPQVSAMVRYEQARPNLLEIPPQDRWKDDTLFGVTLTWMLFDWGARRARVAEASARSAQARLQVEQVVEQISLEVREARINLQDARQRLTVARRAQQSAEQNLTAATHLWKNGLARHSDVLDAHNQLTSAQYETIVASADLELAGASLDHATGRLVPAPAPDAAGQSMDR
jgi:outer membrane protein